MLATATRPSTQHTTQDDTPGQDALQDPLTAAVTPDTHGCTTVLMWDAPNVRLDRYQTQWLEDRGGVESGGPLRTDIPRAVHAEVGLVSGATVTYDDGHSEDFSASRYCSMIRGSGFGSTAPPLGYDTLQETSLGERPPASLAPSGGSSASAFTPTIDPSAFTLPPITGLPSGESLYFDPETFKAGLAASLGGALTLGVHDFNVQLPSFTSPEPPDASGAPPVLSDPMGSAAKPPGAGSGTDNSDFGGSAYLVDETDGALQVRALGGHINGKDVGGAAELLHMEGGGVVDDGNTYVGGEGTLGYAGATMQGGMGATAIGGSVTVMSADKGGGDLGASIGAGVGVGASMPIQATDKNGDGEMEVTVAVDVKFVTVAIHSETLFELASARSIQDVFNVLWF